MDTIELYKAGDFRYEDAGIYWYSLYNEPNSAETFEVDFGMIQNNGYEHLFTYHTSYNGLLFSYNLKDYLLTNAHKGFYVTLKRFESGSEFIPFTVEFTEV